MDFLLRKSGGPLALFAKDYELLHDGSPCCDLGFYDWKYVELLIGGSRYVVRSDGKARWVLQQSGIDAAYCKRHASGAHLEFAISFDDRVWCVKPNREKFVLTHEIWEENLKIGRISPRIKFWWPEVDARFNEVPRMEVASFAIWLIGIHWVGIAGKLTAGRAEIGM